MCVRRQVCRAGCRSCSGRRGRADDAILLAHALPGRRDLERLAALALALPASRERLLETVEQGRALGLTVNAIAGQDWPAMPYPVALGAAARGLGCRWSG
jgi:urease accessory protein